MSDLRGQQLVPGAVVLPPQSVPPPPPPPSSGATKTERPLEEVHIEAHGINITIKAHEPIDHVLAKARELFEHALRATIDRSLGPGTGFGSERRTTPDNPSVGPYGGRGFGKPVQA